MKKWILGLFLLISSSCFGSDGYQMDMFASGINKEGQPLSGGRVYFYEVGSSTTANVYSDVECTSALVQPVTLSASGTYEIYGNNTYKVVIKDADDVVFDTFDTFKYSDASNALVQNLTLVTANNSTEFNTLISSLATSNTNLFINSDILVTNLVTVPASIDLWFGSGGKFTYQAPSGSMTINGGIVSSYGRSIFASFPYTALTIRPGTVPVYYSDQGNMGGSAVVAETFYIRSNLTIGGTISTSESSITINSNVIVTGSMSVNDTLSVTGSIVFFPVAYAPTVITGSRYAMFTSNTADNLLTLRRYPLDQNGDHAYFTLFRIAAPTKVDTSLPAEATVALVIGDGNTDADLEAEIEVVDIYNNKYPIPGTDDPGAFGGYGGFFYDVSQYETDELNYSTSYAYGGGAIAGAKDKQQWGMRYFINDSSAAASQNAAFKPYILDFVDRRTESIVATTLTGAISYGNIGGYGRTSVRVTDPSIFNVSDNVTVYCSNYPQYNGSGEVVSKTGNFIYIGGGYPYSTNTKSDAVGTVTNNTTSLYPIGVWRMLMIEPKSSTTATSNNIIKLFGKTRVIADTALYDVLQADVNNKSVGINADGESGWNLVVSGNTNVGTVKIKGKADSDSNSAKIDLYNENSDRAGFSIASNGNMLLNHYNGSVWKQPFKVYHADRNVYVNGSIFDESSGYVGIGVLSTAQPTANLVIRGNNPAIWLEDSSATGNYTKILNGTGDGGLKIYDEWADGDWLVWNSINPANNFMASTESINNPTFCDNITGSNGRVLFKDDLADLNGYLFNWDYATSYFNIGAKTNSGIRTDSALVIDGELRVSSNVGTINAVIYMNYPTNGTSVSIKGDKLNGLVIDADSVTINALSTAYNKINLLTNTEVYGDIAIRGDMTGAGPIGLRFTEDETGVFDRGATTHNILYANNTEGFTFSNGVYSSDSPTTVNVGAIVTSKIVHNWSLVFDNASGTVTATPNASLASLFILSKPNTGDMRITTITGGIDGQEITLLTDKDNPTSASLRSGGNIQMPFGVTYIDLLIGAMIKLVYRSSESVWYVMYYTGV